MTKEEILERLNREEEKAHEYFDEYMMKGNSCEANYWHGVIRTLSLVILLLERD